MNRDDRPEILPRALRERPDDVLHVFDNVPDIVHAEIGRPLCDGLRQADQHLLHRTDRRHPVVIVLVVIDFERLFVCLDKRAEVLGAVGLQHKDFILRILQLREHLFLKSLAVPDLGDQIIQASAVISDTLVYHAEEFPVILRDILALPEVISDLLQPEPAVFLLLHLRLHEPVEYKALLRKEEKFPHGKVSSVRLLIQHLPHKLPESGVTQLSLFIRICPSSHNAGKRLRGRLILITAPLFQCQSARRLHLKDAARIRAVIVFAVLEGAAPASDAVRQQPVIILALAVDPVLLKGYALQRCGALPEIGILRVLQNIQNVLACQCLRLILCQRREGLFIQIEGLQLIL